MKNLPPAIRDDLARCWGLDPVALTFLGGGEDWSDGTLFTAPGSDGEWVLKVLDFPADDRGALDRAEDRIGFVRFFGERGCRIVMPLPSQGGTLFEAREEAGRLFLAYAYRKVTGQPPRLGPAPANEALFRSVGAELGRTHAAWESRGPVVRPDGTGTESRALKGWRDEMAFFRTWCQDDMVRAAWDRLREALETLPVTPTTYGFVHNDAHLGNFLVDPRRLDQEPVLSVIDFDVANYHWYLNDCAVALYSFDIVAGGGIEAARLPSADFRSRAAEAFWEGYARHKDPTDLGLDRLEWFYQYRRCLLFMPFQDQTAGAPAWRRRWIDRIVAADRRLFG